MKDGRLAPSGHLDLSGVVNGGDHPSIRHSEVFPSGKTLITFKSHTLTSIYFS